MGTAPVLHRGQSDTVCVVMGQAAGAFTSTAFASSVGFSTVNER